jgi:hypothetical protein
MVNDSVASWFGRTISVNVKVGNQPALQVLTTQGIFAGGLATTPFSPPAGYSNWPAAKLWKLTTDKRGYYMLDSFGGYWYGGNTFPLTSKGAVLNLQDMAIGPDGVSYYELLGDGSIYRCDQIGCSSAFTTVPIGIQARSLALTADGKGVYVVDGFGNVYRGGNAPALSGAVGVPLSSNLVRRIKLTPSGTGYYLMDMYGRIWNGGSAPALSPGYTPQIGVDWARDFEVTADGSGFYLLAKTGAIYPGGAAVPLTVNVPPTSPNDIGRSLALVDARTSGGPYLQVNPTGLGLYYAYGSGKNPTFSITIANASGVGSIDWTATLPAGVSLNATSGTVYTTNVIQGAVSAGGYQIGTYNLGSILFTGTTGGKQPVSGSPQNVPLTLRVFVASNVFLPLVVR